VKGMPSYLQSSTAYRMLGLPRDLRRSATIILTCFALLTVAVLFIPWQQTAVGDGRVIAFDPAERLQIITANLDGRIEKWYVREGDKVREGDVLALMADNDPEIIVRLKKEREALVREIEALQLGVQLASRNRDRQKELLKKEFSTDFNVEQARISEARAQKDLADAEGRLARLDTQIARQMTLEIRSPRDGVVQSILAGENSGLLKSGVAIAHIVPETDERTVELYVNGLDLPFIRVGQDVRLQFEGWPILQFSGLPQLSTGTFLGTIKIIDPSDDGRGRFRIIVKRKEGAIWPSPELLRQGVRTRGWVQMNQVPLWFEIWRLINDLPPATPPLTTGGESAANPPTPRSPPAEPESSSSPTTTNPVPAR
jgi:multidrug efflux pump subunit AcrA (membrane-fusion protein)